jgi:hypothetical protein
LLRRRLRNWTTRRGRRQRGARGDASLLDAQPQLRPDHAAWNVRRRCVGDGRFGPGGNFQFGGRMIGGRVALDV